MVYALPAVVRITAQGVRAVNPAALESSRSLGATGRQQLFQVQLPLARPALLLAVNQGVVLVLAVVVIGGLVGGGALGYDAVFGLAQGDLATGLVSRRGDRLPRPDARPRHPADTAPRTRRKGGLTWLAPHAPPPSRQRPPSPSH